MVRTGLRIAKFLASVALIASLPHTTFAGEATPQSAPVNHWSTLKLRPVTKQEDDAYRQMREAELAQQQQQSPTNSGAGGQGGVGETAQLSGEGLPLSQTVSNVAELARALKGTALKSDPDVVYQYVHDNIAFLPATGSKKSAFGVLLDGSGNDIGQTKLMVDLLRASGHDYADVQYVRNEIRLTALELQSWLGTDDLTSAAGLLALAGIPHTVNATTIDLLHWWVGVNVNGTWYYFDPSYKSHTTTAPIPWNTIFGSSCTGNTALTAALSGATITADYAQTISGSGLEAHLNGCATTLVDYLRANLPGASLADVIGGRTIIPDLVSHQYTEHPKITPGLSSDCANPASTICVDEVPNADRASIDVWGLGLNIAPLWADEISGKRLTLNTSGGATLYLDGTLLDIGDLLFPGSYQINITIDHAYAGGMGDETVPVTVFTPGLGCCNYNIINGWGGSSRGAIEHYRRKAREAKLAGGADTSEAVMGNTLAQLGSIWLAEAERSWHNLGAATNVATLTHNLIGVAAYDGAPHFDISGALTSHFDLSDDQNLNGNTGFFTAFGHGSAFEGGAMAQTVGDYGISTISLLKLASDQNQKIFRATSSNWLSSVKPALTGYPAWALTDIEASVNAGSTIYLPESGNLTNTGWTWHGLGFISHNEAAGGANYTIGGGYNGGATSTPKSASDVNNGVGSSNENPRKDGDNKGGDPVALFTGDYLYNHQDISVGSSTFPHGLGFQRNYTSRARLIDRGLGLGWQHNFDITATDQSDALQGLGEDSAIDAATTIVGTKIAFDIIQSRAANCPGFSSPACNLPIATIVQQWYSDKLANNIVLVNGPTTTEQFVKLPDGTYNPPPGSSSRLTKPSTTYVYQTINGDTSTFDANGKITQWSDPNGFDVTFTYGAPSGALSQVTNEFGRSLTLNYTGTRITSVTTDTRSISYAYTGNDLTTFTDARSNATTYQYDIPGRMASFKLPTRPTENYLTNTYDALGRIKEQRNADNLLYQFFIAGTRSQEVDPLGKATTWHYDALGHITKVVDKVGRITTSIYDGFGRLDRTEFPEGNAVEYDYDDSTCNSAAKRCTNNVLQIRRIAKVGSGDPTLTQSFTYETEAKFYKVKTATDPNGKTTDFEYDAAGNLLSITAPDPDDGGPLARPVTNFVYYPTGTTKGFLQTVTDPTNRTIDYAYNTSTGDTTKTITAAATLALTTCYDYDAVGNLTKTVDPRYSGGAACNFPAGQFTLRTYDNNRNVTQITLPDPDGAGGKVAPVTKYVYDQENQLTETRALIGAQWEKTVRTYNKRRLVEFDYEPVLVTNENDAIPANTIYDYTLYDDADRVLETGTGQSGQPNEQRTLFTYFDDGKSKDTHRGFGSASQQNYASYTYTTNGLIATVTDAGGNLTTYEYDGHDRLKKLRYPNISGGGSSTTDFEQYTYDNNGNVTTKRIRSGATATYTYDNLNRNIFVDLPATAPDVTSVYDAAGRKTEASITGRVTSYVYDNAGRVDSVTDAGRVIDYGYDAASNRNSILWPGSPTLQVDYTYDTLSRLTTVAENGGSTLATYDYDDLSRRSSVVLNNGTTTSYAYEPDSALDSITHDFTGTAYDVTFAYNYNKQNQATQTSLSNTNFQWTPSATASETYGDNGLNQVTTVGANAAAYDSNGNLTTHPAAVALMPQPALTISNDTANRPVEIINKATYDYDGESRRVKKICTAGCTTTEYLYDVFDLIAEYDGSGNLLRRYVPGPAGEPVVWYEYNAGALTFKRWFYTDRLGSIVTEADASGNVVTADVYTYGPYGEVYSGAGLPTGGSTFRYSGQIWDSESGLLYLRRRYYSASLGRFNSTDPIGFLGGMNLYGYVDNDPVDFVDPDGTIAFAFPLAYYAAYAIAGGIAAYVGYSAVKGIANDLNTWANNQAATPTSQDDEVAPTPPADAAKPGSRADAGTPGKTDAPANATPGDGGNKQDAKKKGPAPNNGNARPHGGPEHNRAIDDEIQKLRQDPDVSNIRKNQVQVDAKGNRVGNNRPDLQYDRCGVHHCVEYDTANSKGHGPTIRANDPNAKVEIKVLP